MSAPQSAANICLFALSIITTFKTEDIPRSNIAVLKFQNYITIKSFSNKIFKQLLKTRELSSLFIGIIK